MGSMGAFVKEKDQYYIVEATKVKSVDTTAAGDCFSGTLCVGISEGKSLLEAVKTACRASAITVTRMGLNLQFRIGMSYHYLKMSCLYCRMC